jgi:hypothetical protein
VAYVMERRIAAPTCFISYAWGDPEHERWVERDLATDLRKAGIKVMLDRWSVQLGDSVLRFIENARKADRVIVVGTPLYRMKYENSEQMGDFVLETEGELIGTRLIRRQAGKRSVVPVLRAGTDTSSFPELLVGRAYADFRRREDYFVKSLDLLLDLYQVPAQDPLAAELRDSLRESPPEQWSA